MKYGSSEWLARLPAGCVPVGRLNGLVVVELAGGRLWKIVGGTPESPSCVGLSSDEIRIFKPNPPTIGTSLVVTWVEWYNKAATASQQEKFDRVTKEIDEAGLEGLPGGSKAGIIDTYRFSEPSLYPALLNYRDTGGRRALFAKNVTDYGPNPIAKPREGGPLEEVNGQIILRPGRYTYSDPVKGNPAAGRFREWLTAQIRERKAQPLRTQVSETVFGDIIPGITAVADPYYIDVEFLVAVDLPWPKTVPGLPTWLPMGKDVQSYWGPPTPHAPPDIDALRRFGQGVVGAIENIATLAVVLGIGYLLMLIGTKGPERARA